MPGGGKAELRTSLARAASDKGTVLFGQEFFNSFRFPAIGPTATSVSDEEHTKSDCFDVLGVHPAVLGQDFLYYLYKGPEHYAHHAAAARFAHDAGCFVTFDWHMEGRHGHKYQSERCGGNPLDEKLMRHIRIGKADDVEWFEEELDRVVSIINELGIPIVLRLFHEMNGNWMWWGKTPSSTPEDYISFFQFAVTYIRNRCDLCLFAWSPNFARGGGDGIVGIEYYPGDEFVDVVGLDAYDMGKDKGEAPLNEVVNALGKLVEFAVDRGKIPIFAETGDRTGVDPTWWPLVIGEIVEAQSTWSSGLAWVLTWVCFDVDSESAIPFVPHQLSDHSAKQSFFSLAELGARFCGHPTPPTAPLSEAPAHTCANPKCPSHSAWFHTCSMFCRNAQCPSHSDESHECEGPPFFCRIAQCPSHSEPHHECA